MNHIRPVFLTLAFTASLLDWSSIVVTPATAETVTVNFIGELTNDGSFLPTSPFSIGQHLIGSYTLTTPLSGDVNPDTAIGQYNGAVTDLSVTIGSFNWTRGTGGVNTVLNDDGTGTYSILAPMTGNSVNPGISESFPLAFRLDTFHPTIGSDAMVSSLGSLFTTPPNSAGVLTFQTLNESQPLLVYHVTSTTLTAVSLPPAMILFGTGIVALVGLGARSWRQKEQRLV